MKEEEAMQFYKRLTEGTEHYKTIDLEHKSGATLADVKMHAIDKQALAGVIERLPDAMFESVEGAEDAEEAEEEFEEAGGNLSAVTEETVEAFEDLVAQSLTHESLTAPQIRTIAEQLDFETLFELGTEIINLSVESTGDITDFHAHE